MRARRGSATMLAILMVTVVAVLVVVLEVSASTSRGLMLATQQAAQVDAAIATGAGRAVDEWGLAPRSLVVGGALTTTYVNPSGLGTAGQLDTARVTLRRGSLGGYEVAVRGAYQTANRTRRIPAYRRAFWPAGYPARGAAVVSVGVVNYAPTASLSHTDSSTITAPFGCPAGAPDWVVPDSLIGVLVPSLASVPSRLAGQVAPRYAGNAAYKLFTAPGLSTSILQTGTFPLADVARLATLVVPGGTTFTAGDGSQVMNPPAGLMPIVSSPGAITMVGGTVAGLFVAGGPITLVGTRVNGIVVSTAGGITLSGGASVYGSIVNMDPLAAVNINDTSGAHFSSCAFYNVNMARAISRPVLGAALSDLLRGR